MISADNASKKCRFYLHVLAILGTWTLTHHAVAGSIPPGWDIKINQPFRCSHLFHGMNALLKGVNNPSTRLLAHAAYHYNRHTDQKQIDSDPIKQYTVIVSGYSTPTLFNPSQKLTYKIIGNGNRRVVRVSYDGDFLGQNDLTVTYPLKVTGLKFIEDGRIPEKNDTEAIEALTEQALFDLRKKRVKPLETYLRSMDKSGINSVTHRTADDGLKTPVITLSYDSQEANVNAHHAYFSLENEDIFVYLKWQLDNKASYKKLDFNYSDFEMATKVSYAQEIVSKAFGQPVLRLQADSFQFAKLWDEGMTVYDNEIPAWVPR